MAFVTEPTAADAQKRRVGRGIGGRHFVSVGTKLTAAMLVILVIVTAFTYFQVNRNEREQLLSAKERSGKMVTELFAAGVTAPLSFSDEPGIREHINLLVASTNIVYAAVWGTGPTDPSGGHQRGDKLGESAKVPMPAAASAVGNAIPTQVSVERTNDILIVEQSVVSVTGEVLGVVRVGFSLQRENSLIAAAKERTLFTALAMGFGLAVVLLALTRTVIVKRLAQLAAAAKRLENGEDRVELKSIATNDEVGALSRAFTSMAETIAAREARISARNRDLRHILDNVAEGLMTVKKDGQMSHERSKILDEWFGAPADPDKFFEYFESFSEATARWLRIGWTALADDCMPIEVVFDQMPRRFAHNEKFYELGYLPIWIPDQVGPDGEPILDEVLVVVSDVTSAEKRERAEQAQREAMAIFRRILEDRAGFTEFFRQASLLVLAIETGQMSDSLMRDVHTLKGNTALYGIDGVAEICHSIETRVHEEGGAPTAEEIEQVRSKWEAVRKLAGDLQLSATAHAVELSKEEYADHLNDLQAAKPYRDLLLSTRRWANEPATQRLQRIAEQARSIARRIGKSETQVIVSAQPANLRLPPARWAGLWTVFSHVLRNTLDHGIETNGERVAAGESANGTIEISLSTSDSSEYVELCVSDDGRGIAWDKIRERAAKLGLPVATASDLEEALFADKVTSNSKATQMSGRGVGMGAVRDVVVRQCGGEIVIETERGVGTKLRLRLPTSMLDLPVLAAKKRTAPPPRIIREPSLHPTR